MTSRDFCYWLRGYFEVSRPQTISKTETEMIQKHLSLVFEHEIDPSMGDEKHQEKLNEIHNPAGGNSSNPVFRCSPNYVNDKY